MFENSQEIVDSTGKHPHFARVNTPHHVSLIPIGFTSDDPFNTYEVSVSYESTYYIVQVVPNDASFRLQSAVRRGFMNNRGPLEYLEENLRGSGWEPDFDLENDFRITARNYILATKLPEEASPIAIIAGLELSALCLSYLIVTRVSRGEIVRATRRNVNATFKNDPWEMDPSERDRQTMEHRSLENWLIDKLGSHGIQALDPGYGENSIQFDLAWKRANEDLVVCEVKTTANNEVKQIRLGVGQVLHYALQMKNSGGDVVPCLLVQAIPEDETLVRLAEQNGVRLFSPEKGEVPDDLIH